MEDKTLLKAPKMEEENEGVVPDNTVDELEGILGVKEETDGHGYLHMNWEDEFSTNQFFQDAGLWDLDADMRVKGERSCGYWDFDDKKACLNLSLNYQEVLEAWSNRGPLWAPCSSYVSNSGLVLNVPVMEEEEQSRRQASVMRYKEKRQSRLFSKKIRYEVRRVHAEKRPRIKGRFVKRLGDKMQKGR